MTASVRAKAMIGTAVLAIGVTILFVVGCAIAGVAAFVWIGSLVAITMMWVGLGLLLAFRKLNVSYRLTNQRLIHHAGILRRYSDRIEVIDMDDISCEQGIIERFLDVGTIRIASSDRTHPDMLLSGIDGVHEVASRMDDARRRERIQRGIHIESV